MYRVVILTDKKILPGQNFDTKPEAEDYILSISDSENIKRADILNKETGQRERMLF